MENILITGGAGYKGVVLTAKLLELDYKITVLDNFMYGPEPLIHLSKNPKLKIVKADIRNKISNLKKYDIIIHLAGISGLPACIANPSSAEMINVDATKSLVKSLSPRQLIINASTTSFYGKSGKKISEDSAVDPISLYGETKVKAEKIVSEHHNSINLRFPTIFGPSPKMRMDLLINDFTYRAMKERVLLVYDGHAIRTFLHVEDAARGYIFSINNRAKMINQKVYNIGDEKLNYSKKQIAEIIQKRIKCQIIDSEVKDKDYRNFIVNFDRINGLSFEVTKTVEDGIMELKKIYSFYEPNIKYKYI